MTSARDADYRFGTFTLHGSAQLLVDNGRTIRLGSRAFEVLRVLVSHAGEVVSRRDLMMFVWPDTTVGEANLAVHISALRRALGDRESGARFIVSVPGQGYRFVAPVEVVDPTDSNTPAPHGAKPNNLPAQLTRLVGRDTIVDDIATRLPNQRLVTVVGPGGIGKTVLALNVAERLLSSYEHGVWLVDLAPLTDPSLVLTAVASTLRVDLPTDEPLSALVHSLRDRKMLLVLDNCEHVIDSVATLTAGLLRGAREVGVLATSREALMIEGERAYRLPPLATPKAIPMTARDALAFPALELFVERAKAIVTDFQLSDADAWSAAEICRRLDGIPLAIEFAAARVDAFGVNGLADGLHERMRSVRGGWRATRPRYQTLDAALDWSYRLLTQGEQTLLRRLSVFTGGFTLEAAQAMADTHSEAADDLASLVRKSLISADIDDREVRFRLLETTRVFAARLLEQTAETDTMHRRHAAYFRDRLEASVASNPALAVRFRSELDNVRTALRWAFSPTGDKSIGVALAAGSAPLWLEMSRLTECHTWMARALEALEPSEVGGRREIVLQTALGTSMMFAQGLSDQTLESARRELAVAALERAQKLAASLQDFDYLLPVFAVLTIFRVRYGDFVGAKAIGLELERFAVDSGDSVAAATADSLLSSAHIGLGEFTQALALGRRGWARGTPEVRRAQITRVGLDHSSVQARTTLGQALWLMGLLDQANTAMQDLVEDAIAVGHPVSLGFALQWSINTKSYGEQLETATDWIALQERHAAQHTLANYAACCLGFNGLLAARRGDLIGGERLLRACLEQSRRARFEVMNARLLGGLAYIVSRMDRFDEALAIVYEAQRLKERGERCMLAENIRVEGEIRLAMTPHDTARAEELFHESIEVARTQRALFWELRATQSLARMHATQGRPELAHALLSAVYDQFTEGFETPDLKVARALLREWAAPQSSRRSIPARRSPARPRS